MHNITMPAITIKNPWATWIMKGWKVVETRTHNRFRGLDGKRILIHAGMGSDKKAFDTPHLTPDQKEELLMPKGHILGSAMVYYTGLLLSCDSESALVDCSNSDLYGLCIDEIEIFEKPIPCKGKLGIWYYKLEIKTPKSKATYSHIQQ